MKAFLLEKYNEVLITGIIPAAWLVGIVCPVLKPGKSAREPTSYRPVSLTSAAGKLMEMTALARLEWIADLKGVFREQQSGFRRQRSTADSLADVVSTFEQARHDKEVAYLLLLDIKSAFDNLPHPAIDDAMDQLGVTGNLRQYIRAFLTNRSLKVRIGKTTSSPRPVETGVPQGSVLSPFLFNVVLATLPDCIPSELHYAVSIAVYADDVALWTHGPTDDAPAVRACLQAALEDRKSVV